MRRLTKSIERTVDTLAGDEQFLDRVDRGLEIGLRLVVERDLDHFFHAIGTENRRHADIEAVEAVLAVYIDSARQDALLVAQISFGHRNRAGGGGVVGGAGLEQANDLAAARAGALDDGVDGFLARL